MPPRGPGVFGGGGGGGGTTIVAAGSLPFLAASAVVGWSNMPLAETEFLGNQNRRLAAYLGNNTEIRLIASGVLSGAAAAVLRIKYSLDQGGSWTAFVGGDVSIATFGAAVAPTVGSWVVIPVEARTDVIVGVFGEGGNGTADPNFILVRGEVR